MAVCEVCGNEYDKAFEITMQWGVAHLDSFECEIEAMAPRCAHCGCDHRPWARTDDSIFCCAHCAEQEGVKGLADRTLIEVEATRAAGASGWHRGSAWSRRGFGGDSVAFALGRLAPSRYLSAEPGSAIPGASRPSPESGITPTDSGVHLVRDRAADDRFRRPDSLLVPPVGQLCAGRPSRPRRPSCPPVGRAEELGIRRSRHQRGEVTISVSLSSLRSASANDWSKDFEAL